MNYHNLSSRTVDRMRRTSCLLGAQRKLRKTQRTGADADDLEDENWEIIYHFRKPNEIVIADDTHSLRIFGDTLFTAPQEDILEGLELTFWRRLYVINHRQISTLSWVHTG
jgi:hypothetical protein